MDLDHKYDRVGPDHKIRSDLRNFLLAYHPNEGTALRALYDGKVADALHVAKELKYLVDKGCVVDYVYQFSTADIEYMWKYVKNEAKVEAAREALYKACKLAFDAGLPYYEFQDDLVEAYEGIEQTKEFVHRFAIEKVF